MEIATITLEKDYKQKYEGFDPNNPSSMIGMTLLQEEYLENSISLASKIQDHLVGDLNRKNRGVKQAPFMVLHKAYMPRVLIETGFISNQKDGDYLDSEEGQQELAQSIAEAIISYKKEYFGSSANENNGERPSKRIVESPINDSSNAIKPAKEVEKAVSEKSSVKKSDPKEEPKTENSDVIFKVQITAVAKKIELIPSNFNGLSNISVITDNGKLFKYAYGSTSDYSVAKQNLQEAKAKGFTTAYLIAFKDGKKINIQEALK